MSVLNDIITGIQSHQIVPYLGPYALVGSCHAQTGEPIPADSDSLIYAMNDGKPMAPKLMYEFPRAAMNLELKRGRTFISRFLTTLYAETEWTAAPLHTWLSGLNLPYVIDINRDLHLQNGYAARPHLLVVGIARVGGTDYRFRLFQYSGTDYQEVTLDEADSSLPILFKPMGTPKPEPVFIASDADYVDYITELMGGFSIPHFMKEYRQGKQYVFLGLPLSRDTERMVMSDIVYAADKPTGWALLPEPNDKEKRFCEKMKIEIVEASVAELLQAAGVEVPNQQQAA